MFLALFISLLLSVLSFLKPNGFIDIFVTIFSSSFFAIPNFLLGPVLILIFSYYFKVLPVSGSDSLIYIILPVLTISLSMSAYLTKIFRTAYFTENDKPYVEFARSKGLSEFNILFKHIFKNAMIPILTVAGLQFGALISGVIITENVFAWQGIGTILISAIKNRDYPLIQGLTMFILLSYLLINFFIDLSYFFIDPKIRAEGVSLEQSY
jgi:ABC-type dipeptide/oligopeptide/nickel transport system permease component